MSGGSPGRVTPEFLDALRDRVRLSDLVRRSVPSLNRHGREWTGLCPFHQEKTASFSVNDAKGIWKCFGCHAGGDTIDFTRRVYGLSFKDAVRQLASENGLDGLTAKIDPVVLQRAEERRRKEDERARRYMQAALRIWNEALPAENSPVERYLRSRAITGPIPTSLRYHPELRYKIADKTWIVLPAMVAEVCNSDGETIAVHRTFLKRDGSGKADVPKAKLMLGDARGGAIYLAPIAEEMNVTEGIETGLSLQLINGLPTAAAASTGNMVALALPALPMARRITIGADNDPNESGKNAAIKTATRWRNEGREVRIKTPRELKDYNDVLRAMAKQTRGMEP